jgi:hypothetical protein
MVKVSTHFYRVDGFNGEQFYQQTRELPDPNIETQFLTRLLEPLLYDPGDELVEQLLRRI